MSMSMSMSMNMATTSTAAAMASSTASSGGHQGMNMGGSDTCKISMLWNWYTIDACFLSSSWHITNNGMFAATCIGIAFLVVALEFFRRLGKEYDAFVLRQFKRNIDTRTASHMLREGPDPAFAIFRATPLQQLIRSVLHAIVFGLAYIIMLLAMYYNGYIIISIIIGAGIGKFFCDWMIQKVPLSGRGYAGDENVKHDVDEPSVCCG